MSSTVSTESTDLSTLTELVIVCGHATFVGSHRDIMSEGEWLLQPFQRSNPATGKRGEHETFISHILSATFAVASRPHSFMVFSGGCTAVAERSEAESYELVHLGLGDAFVIGDRYARDDFATDSFQNLLFSIFRFKQVVGRYPTDITVVTHAFKRDRILGQHAPALHWPAERIRVQGIDPPFTKAEWEDTISNERRAEGEFASDPYGRSHPLSTKRVKRRFDPGDTEELCQGLEPEALQLLRHCNGVEENLPARFPWEMTSD